MWDAFTNKCNRPLNHGTEGKTNKDHACRLKARIERIPQNLTTLLDCATMLLAESGRTTSLAETGNHGLSQRRDTKHGLSQRRNTTATEQGEKLAPKLRETWVQKHHETLKPFSRIRELMESSQPENKTLLRVPRLHSGSL